MAAERGTAPVVAGPRVASVPSPPPGISDLESWLGYRERARVVALPDEARLFHRRARLAWQRGDDVEAVRLARGAAALDPSYPDPHQVLASWFMVREPAQALQSCATLIAQFRSSFLFQLQLASNAAFWFLHALFLGLLAAGLLLVISHQHELRHIWTENLRLALTGATAQTWGWALLLLPFTLGLGLALPVLVLLAMLWPSLRARERFVLMALTAMVVAAPVAAPLAGRALMPLRVDEAPYYGVTALEHAPWTRERQERLALLADRHPDNPYVQFGLGWLARHGGDLRTAETSYRRLLEQAPSDDRALNNLGNILAIQGRFDEAIELYKRASSIDAKSAAPWFNVSQVYTRRFDYNAANHALARASALDFEMVKAYQAASADGELPLVDQWIAPAALWRPVLRPTPDMAVHPDLPPPWRGAIELSGWGFTTITLVLVAGALALGLWWQGRVPLRACSNCGRVVCRRCAERRREVALCPSCASTSARAESPEFARVLLDQQRRKRERRVRLIETVVASIVPGFGLLACRRVFGPIAVLMVGAIVVSVLMGVRSPFSFTPRLGPDAPPLGPVALAVAVVLVYLVSIVGYIVRRSHKSGPAPLIKARPSTPTVVPAEAA
jgi:Flp pilus assembly protein TadD